MVQEPGPGTPPPYSNSGPTPGGYAPYGLGPTGQPLLSPTDQRLWAMFSHLGGFVLAFVAPLIIYLVFKGRGAFVEDQAKESLNFQITIALGFIVSTILMLVIVGFVLAAIIGIASLIFMILASIAAYRGETYRYPINIRFVK